MVFATGDWTEVDNPNGGEAYVNPNVSTDEPSIEAATALTPDEVDSNGWDAVEESLSAPEASSVERVGIDFENGLVDVHDSSGRSTYLLAAVGESGEFSVIDDRGNVSTSEIGAMPLKHHVAITEAILGNANFETDATEMGLGFKDSYREVYDELMSSGSYEALGGDVVFDFDNVEGVSDYKNNDKAKSFIEELDEIAEFFRDYADDYVAKGQEVDPEIPIRPRRLTRTGAYKFAARGTDREANIVVEEEDGDSYPLELNVVAFSGHHGLANGY